MVSLKTFKMAKTYIISLYPKEVWTLLLDHLSRDRKFEHGQYAEIKLYYPAEYLLVG